MERLSVSKGTNEKAAIYNVRYPSFRLWNTCKVIWPGEILKRSNRKMLTEENTLEI
jgi:hypothetical protein